MSATSQTKPQREVAEPIWPVRSCTSIIFLFLLLTFSPLTRADDMDSTGKKITFYPSSLMMSHNAQPLIFYSETKLMHLTTRLKAIPPGPTLAISNNCSHPQREFFDSLLKTIHGTQKVMNRLLSLSSFSNLLECDSYLRRYFTYSTGLTNRMLCPRHYQPTLAACKAWAIQNCRGFSSTEKMFLTDGSRTRRSSFLCHAGLLGILRKIYESLGHSCETNHITNLKDTLRHLSNSIKTSQSMMHVLNGKLVYVLKATDSLTTKLNRLSQDLKIVDNTFTAWQSQLNKFAAENSCHDAILLEFLSKHSNAVNRAFATLLRLTEMQDVLHQFSTLESKTLFGFPHLPPFLHPQIISRLALDPTMTFTSQALSEGFPLLINPMVDIEHQGTHIEAGVLLTIPEIASLNSFCTIEYLSPIKFNSSNVCYTGPVTKLNLVIITCPNSRRLITTEALQKCYRGTNALICPANILNLATNISWLGYPFNRDTKLTFPRNHVPAKDCSNLHPLLHLGGRSFLATTTMVLPLSTGAVTTSPLTIYEIPCNVSFAGMVTGLGRCPQHINIFVPLATASQLQFTPWADATRNISDMFLVRQKFQIPTPMALNKSTIKELETSFEQLDGHLTASISTTDHDIDAIKDTATISTTSYVAYFALSLSTLSCIMWLTVIIIYRRQHEPVHTNTRSTCRCGRPMAQPTSGGHPAPRMGEGDSIHEDHTGTTNEDMPIP